MEEAGYAIQSCSLHSQATICQKRSTRMSALLPLTYQNHKAPRVCSTHLLLFTHVKL